MAGKICSAQIIQLITTGARGGMWEDSRGVCLCACTCRPKALTRRAPIAQTHTWPGSPVAPVFLGFLPVLPPATHPHPRGAEHPTMATYVPTGRARDMPLGPCSQHTHTHPHTHTHTLTQQPVCLLACVCARMHQVSSKQ